MIPRSIPSKRSVRPLATLAICLLVLFGSAEAHRAGYCISQMRKLSDDEKIAIAIQTAIRHYRHSISIKAPGTTVYEPHETINHYKGMTSVEYLARFPDCCLVVQRGFAGKAKNEGNAMQSPVPPSFWDLFWGSTYDFVQVDIDVEYLDSEGQRQIDQTFYLARLTLCGRFVDTPSMYFDESIIRPRRNAQ